MDNMKVLKLQFWSFDMVFAIIIFSITLTIVGFAWYNINNRLSLAYESGPIQMQSQTQILAQSLLSKGSPSDWYSIVNTTNTSTWKKVVIGLGSTSGSGISGNKVYALMAMSNYDYQATKGSLGVTYDYYILVYNNGMNITIGKNPSGALTIDSATESSSINGEPVTIKVLLWTNTTLGVS